MGLSKYKEKRSFNKTPEPEGKTVKTGSQLRFVIQKHDASHLHYDFRLEMEGVLKSWAVPKGPSTDPAVKRLAMMVEDHPYNYRTFEGIIPEGNYGAGTVIVWDEGTYEPAEGTGKTKKEMEKNLLHQLYSGKIKFILHGEKLKGIYTLVKASGRGENAWLLMKTKDEYASTADITKKDRSVQSGLPLEKVAETSTRIWKSNRSQDTKTTTRKSAPAKRKAAAATVAEEEESVVPEAAEDVTPYLKKGRRAAMPSDIKPMLASLVDEPFDVPGWIYEIKWDGYRALGFLNNGKAEIISRNNLPFTERFISITQALKNWKVKAVVDGEIVAVNEDGRPDFQGLQNFAKRGARAKLQYYVFDLLWYNGKDYTQLPLTERKAILKSICPADDPVIRYSDHVDSDGIAFFEASLTQGLEGVMAKKADSVYAIGYRTKSWLKVKNNHRMEAIICGFTKPRQSRKYFGAVILGKYEGDTLIYVGHSGSGFNDKGLKEMYERFKPLIIDECPFEAKPKTNMPVTWLKPHFVCEVKFAEWTEENILRQPIFLGLREDKTAKDEKNTVVVHAPEEKKERRPKAAKASAKTTAGAKAKKTQASGKAVTKEKSTVKKTSSKTAKEKAASAKKKKRDEKLVDGKQKDQQVEIDGQELKLTNISKLYFPKDKVTKGDVINYYHSVAPYILPYMLDRPQSLNRHPNGIAAPGFYQKNVEGKVADWIGTHYYDSESAGDKQFLVCTGEASLLYMASLGCIEMNPWHSRTASPENPDWCVIDLDPDANPFTQVTETAQVVKQVLDSIGVPSYPKTSGSTGIHIYIPLGAKYTYEQSKILAELVATMVHNELPDSTSLERSPSRRKGKIYLDFLQNRTIQTIAAPYSLRPRSGATVSMPVRWEEVNKSLKISDFTIHNALDRIQQEGDIFKPVLGKGIDLEKTLENINRLL